MRALSLAVVSLVLFGEPSEGQNISAIDLKEQVCQGLAKLGHDLAKCIELFSELETSKAQQFSKLIAHAVFYMSPNHRPAEVACYMRQIQRLNFDPQSRLAGSIKAWFKVSGVDKRVVTEELLAFVGSMVQENRFYPSKEKRPAPLKDVMKEPVEAIFSEITNERRSEAAEHANRLAEAIKAVRSETDLDYAAALEFVGNLQSLQGEHATAVAVYARVLEIRRSARPFLERYLGIERPPPDNVHPPDDYRAKKDLRRIMSKLADTYWIVGQDYAATALRNKPQTREGDADRIHDIESADDLADRMLQPWVGRIHPDHPSCVAQMDK